MQFRDNSLTVCELLCLVINAGENCQPGQNEETNAKQKLQMLFRNIKPIKCGAVSSSLEKDDLTINEEVTLCLKVHLQHSRCLATEPMIL